MTRSPPTTPPKAKKPIAPRAKTPQTQPTAPLRHQSEPIAASVAEALPTEAHDDYLEPDATDADPRLGHRETSEEKELEGSIPHGATER